MELLSISFLLFIACALASFRYFSHRVWVTSLLPLFNGAFIFLFFTSEQKNIVPFLLFLVIVFIRSRRLIHSLFDLICVLCRVFRCWISLFLRNFVKASFPRDARNCLMRSGVYNCQLTKIRLSRCAIRLVSMRMTVPRILDLRD